MTDEERQARREILEEARDLVLALRESGRDPYDALAELRGRYEQHRTRFAPGTAEHVAVAEERHELMQAIDDGLVGPGSRWSAVRIHGFPPLSYSEPDDNPLPFLLGSVEGRLTRLGE